MKGWNLRMAAAAQTGLELQQAARVGRDQRLCLGREQVVHLTIAKLGSRFWLNQVIDTRRTAAEIGLGHLTKIEARDSPE